MKTLSQQSRVALMLVALGGVAFGVQAQTAAPAASQTASVAHQGRHSTGAHDGQREARRAAHFAARTNKLHDALKLTATQEPAWGAYIAALKPQAHAARPDVAKMAALPAPEREANRIAMAKRHLAEREARLPALTAFYGGLNADQKTLFNKAQWRTAGGEHGWMGHGHRHHHEQSMRS
jgi:protein CpxP